MRIFAYLGAKGDNRIAMKFCVEVGVRDIISHANLGDGRFRGFWGSGGRISHFYWLALPSLKHSGTPVIFCTRRISLWRISNSHAQWCDWYTAMHRYTMSLDGKVKRCVSSLAPP